MTINPPDYLRDPDPTPGPGIKWSDLGGAAPGMTALTDAQADEQEKAELRARAERAEAKVEAALAYCDHLDRVTADDIAIDDPEDEAYRAAESTRFVTGHFRGMLKVRRAG